MEHVHEFDAPTHTHHGSRTRGIDAERGFGGARTPGERVGEGFVIDNHFRSSHGRGSDDHDDAGSDDHDHASHDDGPGDHRRPDFNNHGPVNHNDKAHINDNNKAADLNDDRR